MIGTEIENITIDLNKGWNLIGYPSLTEQNANVVLAGINDSLINVLGYENKWLSYSPFKSENSLKTLKPGFGYWVNVNNNVTLQIS